jgi:hypothetical protein
LLGYGGQVSDVHIADNRLVLWGRIAARVPTVVPRAAAQDAAS